MNDKEIIETIRSLALEIRENNDKEEWIEKFIHTIYEQIIEPLQKQLKNLDWYKMWHTKLITETENLTTELETYRPTKLSGNGQCKCDKCGMVCWTDWFSKYKGKTLCDKCLKEIMGKE